MSKETDRSQHGYALRFVERWIGKGNLSNPTAIRLASISFYMFAAYFIIAAICVIYSVYVLHTGGYAYLVLIPFAIIMIFSFKCAEKIQMIQKLSVAGNKEEMERIYSRGRIIINVGFAISLIVTLILLYYSMH